MPLFIIVFEPIYIVYAGRCIYEEAIWPISNDVAISLVASMDIEMNILLIAMICRIKRGKFCQKRTRIPGQWVEKDTINRYNDQVCNQIKSNQISHIR